MSTAAAQPSRLDALRALAALLPSVRLADSTFGAAMAAAAAASDAVPAATAAGLKLVKCRRCSGTGNVRTRRGMESCCGHEMMGCFAGRSFGPAERVELRKRRALVELERARVYWRALAAIEPATRRDAQTLVSKLEIVERRGFYARELCRELGAV